MDVDQIKLPGQDSLPEPEAENESQSDTAAGHSSTAVSQAEELAAPAEQVRNLEVYS